LVDQRPPRPEGPPRQAPRAYGGRCAITGHPQRGAETNHVAVGLLPLRADLQTILDCGLPTIAPNGLRVVLAPPVRGSSYGKLRGRALRERAEGWPEPSAEALWLRFEEFRERYVG
jgi:putative restriction endonuclease